MLIKRYLIFLKYLIFLHTIPRGRYKSLHRKAEDVPHVFQVRGIKK